MRPITSIEELHAILLEMANQFHRICEENNVPYYMLGGTMLGAMRHKGFIPWDDDMDFGVPRIFFEKCIICLREGLPSRYKVIGMEDSRYVVGMVYKIVDKTTAASYHFIDGKGEEYGVNIDIFPLDKTNSNKRLLSKNNLIQIFKGIDTYRLYRVKDLKLSSRLGAYLIKILFIPFNRQAINHFIQKQLIVNEGEYIANHAGHWKLKEIVPQEWFGKPTLYEFEDTHFYGVCDYDAYLTQLYGNWHELPPERKRKVHLNNVYVK